VGLAVSARDEVLDRVRRAAASAAAPTVPRDYQRADDAPASLALLVDRLLDYQAAVHRCSASELPSVLASVVTGRFVVPDGFPVPVERSVPDAGLTPAELDELDGALTTCAVAIAVTGTVVLDAGPGQGRRALTLVPDRHVVVVKGSQVVQTVPQALARLDPTRPQTWISGPSATSDIELQRVEGVHGPRTLVVVLVEDA
jgi:L-lactate dehydrogenase complex protein LldG